MCLVVEWRAQQYAVELIIVCMWWYAGEGRRAHEQRGQPEFLSH